jgi:hypothetical protein
MTKKGTSSEPNSTPVVRKLNASQTPFIQKLSKKYLSLETPARRLKQVLQTSTAFSCNPSIAVNVLNTFQFLDEEH